VALKRTILMRLRDAAQWNNVGYGTTRGHAPRLSSLCQCNCGCKALSATCLALLVLMYSRGGPMQVFDLPNVRGRMALCITSNQHQRWRRRRVTGPIICYCSPLGCPYIPSALARIHQQIPCLFKSHLYCGSVIHAFPESQGNDSQCRLRSS